MPSAGTGGTPGEVSVTHERWFLRVRDGGRWHVTGVFPQGMSGIRYRSAGFQAAGGRAGVRPRNPAWVQVQAGRSNSPFFAPVTNACHSSRV